MSTNTSKLSAAQLSANRTAIHSYIANATAKYGRGSVILLPEFEEGANGEWTPVVGTGIRPTSNNSAFLRLGKMGINQSTGKPMFLYTNHFGDSENELSNMLAYVDSSATIGSAVKGIRLVVHEQLVPFSRTNPDRDIKWADADAKLACTKNIADDDGVVTAVPIYRRTKVFFADDEGNYPDNAKNILIAHDNALELSEAAFRKFQAKPNAGMQSGTNKAARVAQLQAIPVKNRSNEEKIELMELLEA
jgi:hypothetical protein